MKKILKEIHKQAEIGCYPIDPIGIYILIVITIIMLFVMYIL